MEKFNSNWWDNFLKQTVMMTQTSVVKDCFSEDETFLMRKYVLEVLAEIAKLRTTKFGYRVYVDGVLLENNETLSIFDFPPLKGEDINEWVHRTFGNKKFGMIINQGERFNLALSKLIAFKLEPLLYKMGMPSEGIIFTLFIGNYDSTPLGIHLDLPGKSVIHFHLGPGRKTMYTWDKKEYENLVGEKIYNNQNVNEYLPYANRYSFDEGDIYFMPEDTYHIGTQEGLSVAIACWYNNRSKDDFAKQLQSFVLENYMTESKSNLKADKNKLDDITIIEESLALINIPEELSSLTYKDLIREEYRDFRYSMFSNGGYRTSPFPKPETEEVLININYKVQVEQPFKILYKDSLDGGKLHLFIRGIKVETKNFQCIKELIDTINLGYQYKVSDLLKILDNDWHEEVGLYLLNLLYRYHGISVLSN